MRMRSLSHYLFALFALAATATVLAAESGAAHTRYKWRDAGGNLHYSDGLPPEAGKFGYDVIGPQGLVIRHVDRAKTADEISAAKKDRATEQAAQDARNAARRADAQLLSGYPQEADLKRTQAQKLALLDQQINSAEVSLRSQEQSLADLLARAADTERAGKTLPDAQASEIATLRKQVDTQRVSIERRQNERTHASTAFDAETARYRQLKATSQNKQP